MDFSGVSRCTVCRFRKIRLHLPTPRITDARRRVPRNCNDFVERFLNPNRVVIVEMDDRAQGFAIVEMILQGGVGGERSDASLDPCVSCNALRLRKPEIFHQAEALRV